MISGREPLSQLQELMSQVMAPGAVCSQALFDSVLHSASFWRPSSRVGKNSGGADAKQSD